MSGHKANIPRCPIDVRFQGQSRHDATPIIGGTISKIRYGIQWDDFPKWDTLSARIYKIISARPWAPFAKIKF
jgi:hypothetical protein